MEFRTAIRTPENLGIMHHSDVMTMLGSCFTENIGAKLRGAMMNVEITPFGTIYNPLSMASCVQRLVDAVAVCPSHRAAARRPPVSFLYCCWA